MLRVTLSPKFQVVIPRAIRERLALKPGQQFQALEVGGRIELFPLEPMSAGRGFLAGIDTSVEREGDRA